MKKIKVAVNGYGVIGKRVADAIQLQDDMELAGVCDIISDWRIKIALRKNYPVYAFDNGAKQQMSENKIPLVGTLAELIKASDIIVDCTPKKIAAQNIELYKKAGLKFIVQGGEKHETTGHSFSAENNYSSALGLPSTRVVSCNTTSIVRTLTALKNAGLLSKARGTLLRRAVDPWESHLNGIMNTLVPEQDIPSHQGPDAQTVDPSLDVITVAVKVPETLSHLHYWNVQLTKKASKEEVLAAFGTSSRTAFINYSDGLTANNTVKELMLSLNRPYGDMYEVALWQDMLTVVGDELFYAYLVDNQAIVIPETIDAIRALTGLEILAENSIRKTNESLGIRRGGVFKQMNNLKPIIFLFPVIALILIAILYITLHKKVTNKSAFKSLILIITVFAFFLNLIWELLQMPLYDRASFTINHITFCALGAVADAIMVLLLYLGFALIFKTPFWIHPLKGQRIVLLVFMGGIGAALSEMHHLSLGNWAYSDVMPLIPIINVGISPVLQFMILPVFTYILSFYGLKIINNKNLNLE